MSDLLGSLDRFLEAAARVSKLRALRPVERGLTRAMQRAFLAQRKGFMRRFGYLRRYFEAEITEAITERDWQAAFDEAMGETEGAFTGAITAAARKAMRAGARKAITDIGMRLSFTLRNPRAVAYLQAIGAARVTAINETTRQYLRTVIANGVAEGWSYDRMASAIIERYKEFAVGRPQQHIDSRAHLIAVTEAGEAYEHANYIVGQDLRDAGIEMEKHWSTMGDNRVSDGCLENEADGDDGWVPFDYVYQGGGTPCQRPLRFPGCRCDLMVRRKGTD